MTERTEDPSPSTRSSPLQTDEGGSLVFLSNSPGAASKPQPGVVRHKLTRTSLPQWFRGDLGTQKPSTGIGPLQADEGKIFLWLFS